MSMTQNRTLGYITANYITRENSVLTANRPLASVPFMGRYRLIDFPLSNMMNAGIKTVGLVMPGNCRSIMDHVGCASCCATSSPTRSSSSAPISPTWS